MWEWCNNYVINLSVGASRERRLIKARSGCCWILISRRAASPPTPELSAFCVVLMDRWLWKIEPNQLLPQACKERLEVCARVTWQEETLSSDRTQITGVMAGKAFTVTWRQRNRVQMSEMIAELWCLSSDLIWSFPLTKIRRLLAVETSRYQVDAQHALEVALTWSSHDAFDAHDKIVNLSSNKRLSLSRDETTFEDSIVAVSVTSLNPRPIRQLLLGINF